VTETSGLKRQHWGCGFNHGVCPYVA